MHADERRNRQLAGVELKREFVRSERGWNWDEAMGRAGDFGYDCGFYRPVWRRLGGLQAARLSAVQGDRQSVRDDSYEGQQTGVRLSWFDRCAVLGIAVFTVGREPLLATAAKPQPGGNALEAVSYPGFERARLYRLRKNSCLAPLCVRARIQSLFVNCSAGLLTGCTGGFLAARWDVRGSRDPHDSRSGERRYKIRYLRISSQSCRKTLIMNGGFSPRGKLRKRLAFGDETATGFLPGIWFESEADNR